jgi:hypothetical protein
MDAWQPDISNAQAFIDFIADDKNEIHGKARSAEESKGLMAWHVKVARYLAWCVDGGLL